MKKNIFYNFKWSKIASKDLVLAIVIICVILVSFFVFLFQQKSWEQIQRINFHLFVATLIIIFGIVCLRFINKVHYEVERIPFWDQYTGRWKALYYLTAGLFVAPVTVGVIWIIITIFFLIMI